MSKPQGQMIAGFTTSERDCIRRELDRFFTTLPSVAEGLYPKSWRGRSEADKPKIAPAAKGLMERGLMRLDTQGSLPRLFLLALQYLFWSIGVFSFALSLPSILKSGSILGIIDIGWLSAVPYVLTGIAMVVVFFVSDRTMICKSIVWPLRLMLPVLRRSVS